MWLVRGDGKPRVAFRLAAVGRPVVLIPDISSHGGAHSCQKLEATMAGTAARFLKRPRSCCGRGIRAAPSHWIRPFSSSGDNIYDVVCVGGGPAGLSLLAALRKPATSLSLSFFLLSPYLSVCCIVMTLADGRESQAPTPSPPGFELPSSKLKTCLPRPPSLSRLPSSPTAAAH